MRREKRVKMSNSLRKEMIKLMLKPRARKTKMETAFPRDPNDVMKLGQN